MTASRRPWIAINHVMSLNGQWTKVDGRSVGMGSPVDRGLMDLLRAESDIILTGGQTIRSDNPWLHVRQSFARRHRQARGVDHQPRTIIASRYGSMPSTSRCMQRPPDIEPEAWQAPTLVNVPTGGWAPLFERLARDGTQQVLVEAGHSLAAALVAEDLIDDVFVTLAPLWCAASQSQARADLESPMTLMAHATVGDEIFLHWRRRGARPAVTENARSPLQTLVSLAAAAGRAP